MTMKRNMAFTAWQLPHFDGTKVRYMCYGEEHCPSTGKLHYQGYLETFNPHRYPGLKKLLKVQDCKFFPAAADRETNYKYCRGDYTTVDGRYKPLNAIFKEHVSPYKSAREALRAGVKSLLPTPGTEVETMETRVLRFKTEGFHDPDGAAKYDIMLSLGMKCP